MDSINTSARKYWSTLQAEVAEGLFRAALDASYDSILITNADLAHPVIVFVNPSFCRMTGYSQEEILGKTPAMLQGEETDRYVTARLREALEAGQSFEASTVNYRKDGQPFHIEWRTSPVRDAQNRVTHFIAIQRDVTDRVHLIDRLKRKAEMDGLTQLLTRAAGDEEIAGLIAKADNERRPLSLVMIDIDEFKKVNDDHGHLVGDRVLRRVGRLIDGRIRGNDLGIRWGGEEFMLVLWDTALGGACRVSESLRNVTEDTPFDDSLAVTISAGVAEWRRGEDVERTIKRADDALYAAKRSGRNCTRAETAQTPAD